MSYAFSFTTLLDVLTPRAPEHVVRLRQHRTVLDGLLSVGLKVHFVRSVPRLFPAFIEALGGSRILTVNVYKKHEISPCLVLPPVGGAEMAITLLEALELNLETAIFGNPEIQVQICSPSRISPYRTGLLGIAFYLASDTLRWYEQRDFSTTVSRDGQYDRGERIIIYDAAGTFENCFAWWRGDPAQPVIRSCLPFTEGRTDVLPGTISRTDIRNVNLFATLLVHREYQDAEGCWAELGEEFDAEMHALLDEHGLTGTLLKPWVKYGSGDAGDAAFYEALTELMTYAYDEATRVDMNGRHDGILRQMQEITEHYRAELFIRQKGVRP